MSKQGGHHAGKPIVHKEGNGYHSGRRHPKADKVREAVVEKNAATKAARKQNQNDGGKNLAVIPNSSK